MSQDYSNPRHQVRQLLTVGDTLGFVFNTTGTNTADVELFRFRCPRKMTIDESTVVFQTAATVAAANLNTIAIQKAVLGTGTPSTIGSYATLGTTANKTGAALTVTSTAFNAGDHLVVSCLTGTAATSGWKAQMLIGWKETFPSTVDPGTLG